MSNRQQRRIKSAQERKAGNGATSPEPSAKVLIAVPSQEMWHGGFAMNLIAMMLDAMQFQTPGFAQTQVAIENIRGSCIWQQRKDLVTGALEAGCTHLLFIDSDQLFPANTLRRLLFHQKPVVACNIATKQIPCLPTARTWTAGEPRPLFTTEESKGIEQVWRIGAGVMMIDLSILETVEKPWFSVSSEANDGDHYGEDWWFCHQVEKAGFDIFIDHDLSKEIGHVGYLTYTHDHVTPETIKETNNIFDFGTQEEKEKITRTLSGRFV